MSNKKKKFKFDMEAFKTYVNTYDPVKDGCSNDDIILLDMLYGIGLSLDKEEYKEYKGFLKFKIFLTEKLFLEVSKKMRNIFMKYFTSGE